MILSPISVVLSETLEASARYLPLSAKDNADLLAHIPTGEQTYLTITDQIYTEYVLVENQCGVLLITRGVDSTARKFPKGSCAFFETSAPVVKWLICNYDCCSGPCPCENASAAGVVFPTGRVGAAWRGSAVFTGSTPMTFGVSGLPTWASVVRRANSVEITGTPPGSGSFNVAVSASNCSGSGSAVQQGTIVITA